MTYNLFFIVYLTNLYNLKTHPIENELYAYFTEKDCERGCRYSVAVWQPGHYLYASGRASLSLFALRIANSGG